MIDVVLDERDVIGQVQRLDRLLQQLVPRPVRGNEINQGATFRRGELEVPHVDANSTGVGQEPPVARGFIVPTMMQVEDTPLLDLKDMVSKPVRDP